MSTALPQANAGPGTFGMKEWMHIALRLNEPPSNRTEIVPPDLRVLERAGVMDGAIELSGSGGRIEHYLATPSYERSGRKLSIALEEGYHGGVYTIEEGAPSCPFSLLPTTDRLQFVVGKALMPSYHLIDMGSWTNDIPPRTQPPREYDLSTTLYRNVEAWMRHRPDASFFLTLQFHGTGQRSKSLMQTLRSPEDKIALRARGWNSSGPLGMYGMQPPQKGSEPTAVDDDYHARFTLRQRAPFQEVEVRAAVNLDAPGFVDILNGWSSALQWRTQYGMGPLYRFEELRHGFFQGKKEDRYRVDLEAFLNHRFLRQRKGYGSLTAREFWKLVPIPWEKHHSSVEYRPSQTGSTQVGSSRHVTSDRSGGSLPQAGRFGSTALAGPAPKTAIGGAFSRPVPTALRPTVPRTPSRPAETARPGSQPIRIGFNEQDRRPVVFPLNDHMTHINGATRTGKTTLAVDMVLGKLRSTLVPLVVVDPHGSMVKAIKARLTPEEARMTIEINPARNIEGGRVAIGMNVLHIEDREKLGETQLLYAKATIQGDVTYILRSGEGDQATGARIKKHVGTVTLGMLDIPETTLYDVLLILEGKGRTRERARFARMAMNQDVVRYITETLVNTPPDYLQSSQNKVSLFANPLFRAALCQRGKEVVTMRRLLSENRLILINLDHQEIHPEVARFLGAAYMTMIWLAALRGGSEERPLYIFADEWVTFASESFGTILSGGGKRGVHLVLISQSLEQVPQGRNNEPNLLREVKGNVDTYISFRTDDETARYLNQFSRLERFGFDYRHLLTLPDHYAALIHGSEYADMRAEFPPPTQPEDVQQQVEKIIHANTWRYSGPDSSADSPFVIGKGAELDVLEILARHGPMAQGLLQIKVPRHRTDLWEILEKIHNQGFVLKRKDGKYEIVELGMEELWRYVRASDLKMRPSGWRGQGSKEHEDLIDEVVACHRAKGLEARKTPVKEGVPSPDAIHVEGGVTFNDEIETEAGRPDQVRENLHKAGGIHVCFFVPNPDVARRVVNALKGENGWSLFVRQGPGSFVQLSPEEGEVDSDTDTVVAAILSLVEKNEARKVDGYDSLGFQQVTSALPAPMSHQKVRAILETLKGDIVHEIRERRSESGGPIVLLNPQAEQEGGTWR